VLKEICVCTSVVWFSTVTVETLVINWSWRLTLSAALVYNAAAVVNQFQHHHSHILVPVWSQVVRSGGQLSTCSLTPVSDNLRTLVVSHTCRSFDRTFATSVPWIWNSLLPDLKEPSLLHEQFRCSLKTLFGVWALKVHWHIYFDTLKTDINN